MSTRSANDRDPNRDISMPFFDAQMSLDVLKKYVKKLFLSSKSTWKGLKRLQEATHIWFSVPRFFKMPKVWFLFYHTDKMPIGIWLFQEDLRMDLKAIWGSAKPWISHQPCCIPLITQWCSLGNHRDCDVINKVTLISSGSNQFSWESDQTCPIFLNLKNK